MLRIGTAQLHRPARGGAEDARIEGDAVAGRRRAIEIADEARRDVDLDIRPPAAVCIDERTALDDVRGEQAGAPQQILEPVARRLAHLVGDAQEDGVAYSREISCLTV